MTQAFIGIISERNILLLTGESLQTSFLEVLQIDHEVGLDKQP